MKQRLFIQKQQSDMRSLELSVYIWILVCVILLTIAAFIYFYQKKQRAFLLAETRNKIISLRMENIRNRVSPHFIFNTLNRVISHYSQSDSSYKELYNLIKIMRLNLRLTEKLCITLAEEIDFVRILSRPRTRTLRLLPSNRDTDRPANQCRPVRTPLHDDPDSGRECYQTRTSG